MVSNGTLSDDNNGQVTITTGGGPGGSGHTIQDEGSDVANPRGNLNFVGELVAATDTNSTDDRTNVTIDAKTLWLYAA